MKHYVWLVLIALSLIGCDEETELASPQLLFFAPATETRFPIMIHIDGDSVGTITEPTIYEGEFPPEDAPTVVLIDLTPGEYEVETFTTDLTDEEKFKDNTITVAIGNTSTVAIGMGEQIVFEVTFDAPMTSRYVEIEPIQTWRSIVR